MNQLNKILKPIFIICFLLLTGCKGSKVSLSIIPTEEEFQQVVKKSNDLDILFVIDDSGSMKPIQDNLRENFEHFIRLFFLLDFDFRIAVIKTSAYSSRSAIQYSQNGAVYYESGRTVHEFRCGYGNNCGGETSYGRACNGIYGDNFTTNGNGVPKQKTALEPGTDHILSSKDFPNTPEGQQNYIEKFVRNADVGTCGSGDERALQATETVLRDMSSIYTEDNAFPRKNAHFAIIHVGDEPDGKWSSASSSNSRGSLDAHNFTDIFKAQNSNIEDNKAAVKTYVNALVAREQTAVISVHAIQNISDQCDNVSNIGHAQIYMAEVTKGKTISICNDFAEELSSLGQYIIKLATEFHINATDIIEESLKVFVTTNGVEQEVLRTKDESASSGFFLKVDPYRIIFQPESVPDEGATIRLEVLGRFLK